VLIGACWILVAMNGVDKALIFLVLIMAYIALGLAETVLLMRRQFIEQRREKQAAAEDVPGDEEVLRELGAYDETT